MKKIYINNQHCLSLQQLKEHFDNLSDDSDTYLDLLDYARHGDLADWLEDHNEKELSNTVLSIDNSLGDSDYMNRLTDAILANLDVRETMNW